MSRLGIKSGMGFLWLLQYAVTCLSRVLETLHELVRAWVFLVESYHFCLGLATDPFRSLFPRIVRCQGLVPRVGESACWELLRAW